MTQTNENDNAMTMPSPTPALSVFEPRVDVRVRPAIAKGNVDLKFIDELHKKNTQGLGFWHLAKLKGSIDSGTMLIAETRPTVLPEHAAWGEWDDGSPFSKVRGVPVGFAMYTDRYKSHEDVGCIYAVCVSDVEQRSLIGATLVQSVFERMPYSVKLCCCWCAQDLEAGHFWESIGFKPLAFRTGSEKNERIHIFWQKRIREGDVDTPWWYPSLTNGGDRHEDRLVLPIPPGVHWQDPKPMVLPELPGVAMFKHLDTEAAEALAQQEERKREANEWRSRARELREAMKLTPEQEKISKQGGIWMETPEQAEAREKLQAEQAKRDQRKKTEMKAKADKPKREYSEDYLEKARDLCAVWLEQLAGPEGDRLLESSCAQQKYDVRRQFEEGRPKSLRGLEGGIGLGQQGEMKQLPRAA